MDVSSSPRGHTNAGLYKVKNRQNLGS